MHRINKNSDLYDLDENDTFGRNSNRFIKSDKRPKSKFDEELEAKVKSRRTGTPESIKTDSDVEIDASEDYSHSFSTNKSSDKFGGKRGELGDSNWQPINLRNKNEVDERYSREKSAKRSERSLVKQDKLDDKENDSYSSVSNKLEPKPRRSIIRTQDPIDEDIANWNSQTKNVKGKQKTKLHTLNWDDYDDPMDQDDAPISSLRSKKVKEIPLVSKKEDDGGNRSLGKKDLNDKFNENEFPRRENKNFSKYQNDPYENDTFDLKKEDRVNNARQRDINEGFEDDKNRKFQKSRNEIDDDDVFGSRRKFKKDFKSGINSKNLYDDFEEEEFEVNKSKKLQKSRNEIDDDVFGSRRKSKKDSRTGVNNKNLYEDFEEEEFSNREGKKRQSSREKLDDNTYSLRRNEGGLKDTYSKTENLEDSSELPQNRFKKTQRQRFQEDEEQTNVFNINTKKDFMKRSNEELSSFHEQDEELKNSSRYLNEINTKDLEKNFMLNSRKQEPSEKGFISKKRSKYLNLQEDDDDNVLSKNTTAKDRAPSPVTSYCEEIECDDKSETRTKQNSKREDSRGYTETSKTLDSGINGVKESQQETDNSLPPKLKVTKRKIDPFKNVKPQVQTRINIRSISMSNLSGRSDDDQYRTNSVNSTGRLNATGYRPSTANVAGSNEQLFHFNSQSVRDAAYLNWYMNKMRNGKLNAQKQPVEPDQEKDEDEEKANKMKVNADAFDSWLKMKKKQNKSKKTIVKEDDQQKKDGTGDKAYEVWLEKKTLKLKEDAKKKKNEVMVQNRKKEDEEKRKQEEKEQKDKELKKKIEDFRMKEKMKKDKEKQEKEKMELEKEKRREDAEIKYYKWEESIRERERQWKNYDSKRQSLVQKRNAWQPNKTARA